MIVVLICVPCLQCAVILANLLRPGRSQSSANLLNSSGRNLLGRLLNMALAARSSTMSGPMVSVDSLSPMHVHCVC